MPITDTPLAAKNLNRMDYAIGINDARICELDSKKAEGSQLLSLISNWQLDEKTGVITITRYDGSRILFDLNIEKIPVAFELSADGILTMTTDDGTAFEANIGDMIPVLQFKDSDTISVSVSGEGINKTYTFSVKKGSITDEMIESEYLASVTVQAGYAKQYAENAYQSQNNATYEAELARSYAVGGSSVRDGEDTDNAKYYKEQSESYVDTVVSAAAEATESAGRASNSADYAEANAQLSIESADRASNSAVQAEGYKNDAQASAKAANAYMVDAQNLSLGAGEAATEAGISKNEANAQALLSQSYAVGNSGVRDGEDTDNAKYYYQQCKDIAGGDIVTKSEVGAAGGVASLDDNGHVPASQLPSYVDDVIEGQYISSTEFVDTEGDIITPESGKVYVDVSTGNVTSGRTYRWSGSVYAVIGNDLALGTTSSTAFRGDLGQMAYEHSQTTGNPHGVSASDVGLGNVPNVSTNNQTPTYTEATSNMKLTSGEKLTVAFGKIAKAIASLITHLADATLHITAAERTSWNAKVDLSSSQELTNKTYNGYTLGAACAKSVTDSSSASAFGTGTGLVTERDVYYGTPTINGVKTYTSSTNIYAPMAVGSNGYVLKSTGSGAPSWVAQSSLAVGSATKAAQDTNGNNIANTYLAKKWQHILSNVLAGTYTVDDISSYTDILITYGYLYQVQTSMLIPNDVFLLGQENSITDALNNQYAVIKRVSATSIQIISNSNPDWYVRFYAR